MKTIDEQLNIINDTKNGIAQVLNSKGVEVTADTKFADYPDKVAQLMGNAEVDASVSAALTEVTAEYLEQVNAVKAQADGLEESKLDVSVAEATYQPKGDYLTQHQDISGKLDVSVAAETYQPKGAYLTEHQDISGKLDASVAEATYQPKGDYLTQHQDISGKLDVSVAAETYATKQEVNSAGYLTQHQDISGKLDASVAEATYQPKGAYLTEHQDISGKLDVSVAAETYQPKGNYQPAGNYLTEHQDISGKLDASVAAETYQPKGAYLTEHQSLADYALKSELPLVPTNVSAFTNDAGYLTSHQDISNLLDVSTAAETYATKSDVTIGSGSGATLRYDAQDGIADNDAVNGVSLNHIEVCLRFLPYDESEDVNYVVFHDTVVGNIYLWRIGSDWYLSQNDSANATERNYLLKGTATLSLSESYKDTDVKKYDVVFPEAYTLHADTVAFGSGIYIGTSNYGYIYAYDTSVKTLKAAVTEMMSAGYLTQHQDISGKLDASVAEATYQPKGAYLTEHQDISGKLDASVAEATYQPKGNYQPAGNYLTEHQDISGKLDVSVAAETYATKAEVNSAGYLTSHQDISGKLDSSVAASTYATKSEIEGLGAETVTVTNVYGSSVDTEIVPQEMTSIVLKFNNSDMAPSDYVESFSSIKQATIRIPMRSIYWENQDPTSAQTVSMMLWYNDTEEAWYVNPEGAGYIDEYANNYEGYTAWYDALPISQWFDRSHSWKPEGNNGSTYYKANFTAEFEVLSDDDYAYQFTITFDHKRNIICDADTTWFSEWRSQSVQRILAEELTMKQYVDGKFATVPTKTSDLTNDSSFISQHQDISGKLDVSVAAATYQPKGAYLTEHQSLANYATKADIDGGNHYAFRYNPTDASNDVSLNGETVKFSEISFVWEAYEDKQSSISMGSNPWYIQFSSGTNVYGQASGFTIGTSPMTLTCGSQTAEVVSYSWDGSVLTQKSRFATPIEGTINKVTPGTTQGIRCNGTLDLPLTWKEYVDANFLTEEQDIDHKLDASVAAATYALKADSIYAEGDVSTNHGATDDLSTTPVTFTCDKMKFTCEGGWSGMANTSEKSVGLTITCDEGTVKLIKLNGVFTLTTAYAWNEVTEANTITTVKESNLTYNLNEITFNDKVTLTNVTAVTVSNFGSNVQMTTTEHVVTTVKQKIAQLEALIATLHPQS